MNPLLLGGGLVYLVASIALFAFGANFIFFSVVTWRNGEPPVPDPVAPAQLPMVTVQLPIYNELYVARRVIEAAAALDYPRELFQIQVLDDSTDETTSLVAQAVAEARAKGLDISHLHREKRDGYKAGALRNAMESATGELIAIFDADFVPEPDFLRRAVPHFSRPDVAFVQARWGHINLEFSWLTKLQSLAIDAHFMVEQFARGHRGYWFNFNGTAGVWRKVAIEDAGGWTADTLTEDLDLSYRAHLRGWRGQYMGDLVAPAELPAHFAGFRRQQHRWARGSLETAIKLLPQVWRSDAKLGVKTQASAHLLGYTVHLLLVAITLAYPLVVVLSADLQGASTLFGVAYLLALTSSAPAVFFLTGQRQLGRPWWRRLPGIVAATVVGSGLMLNTLRGAIEIATAKDGSFERTAKFGTNDSTTSATSWMRQRYQLKLDRIVFYEIALGGYSMATAWFAFTTQTWGIMLYAAVFGCGLLVVACVSIAESVGVFWNRAYRAEQIRLENNRWAVARAD